MSFNQSSNRKSRRKAVPALGAAGLTLSLSSGGSAAPTADVPPLNTAANRKIVLVEEEIADVSLATFHVFDNESGPPLGRGVRLAAGAQAGGRCAAVACGGCAHAGCAAVACGGGAHAG